MSLPRPTVSARSNRQKQRRLRNGLRLESLENRVVFSGASPIAVNDLYEAVADRPMEVATMGVLVNDTDAEGDALTAKEFLGPKHGTLNLNQDGTFAYTPDPGFTGIDGFVYQVDDGTAESALAAVTISVVPNAPPVGNNDGYSVNEDSLLEVVAAQGVLINDSDSNGDPLSASVATPPDHGELTLNPDGSFSYMPEADFSGTDAFTYQVSDGVSMSDLVVVELTVNPINDPPIADGENLMVNEDETLTFTQSELLQNDTDVENDPLSLILEEGPQHGTLDLHEDGSFSYLPNPNFYGTDQFSYRVTDGSSSSDLATATITVSAVNDAPIANNDSFSMNEDETLSISVLEILANDSDIDSESLTPELARGPEHGTLVLQPDGSFEYTPDSDYFGIDAFTYQLSDGQATSELAVVEISIAPVNDAPTANADAFEVEQGQSLVITPERLLANDSDPDGDSLSTSIATEPVHGTVELQSDGSFVYTPDAGFSGSDEFTYSASDGSMSSSAMVSITVLGSTPSLQANNDVYRAVAGEPLIVDSFAGVLKNDLPTSTALQSVLFRGPQHGELELNDDGSFQYTADSEFAGIDSFIYRAASGDMQSSLAVATIHVQPGSTSAALPLTLLETTPVPPNSGGIQHRHLLSSHQHHHGSHRIARMAPATVDHFFGSVHLGELFKMNFDFFG